MHALLDGHTSRNARVTSRALADHWLHAYAGGVCKAALCIAEPTRLCIKPSTLARRAQRLIQPAQAV
jgi:hypothetical protein